MKRILILNIALACSFLLMAQKQFFSPEKMVEIGVYYYPEAWNPEQWDRDFAKMEEMGFEFTHMAEFAWAQIEPKEGQYDFKWLDKAVELAAKHHLKVIMCTPTPTPPVWLTRKYPDIAVELPNGLKAQHGTREHYSWSSARYRELTTKVVETMAIRYGKDKRIWGWQLDNEPSHYGTYDYSLAAQEQFRIWLQKKYKTIDALNKAWGTAFWSGVYSDFSEIEIPNESRLISGAASFISIVDFKRFSADECASYLALQTSILRKQIDKSQFITSNFMHDHANVDPWRSTTLDFISYTMYPVAGYTNGLGDQGFRLGDPWRISFANDFFRPFKGVTGVMELQPGQVNWGSYNPQPYPGAVHAWLWNAFAGGLDFICSYRFRQPLFGSEQFHYGMVGTDGVTELSGGLQYRQFMKEIRDVRKLYKPNVQMPKQLAERKTALIYNIDNVWETGTQKQTTQWSQFMHTIRYYSGLKTLTCPVDYVDENRDLSSYPFAVAPAFQMADKALVAKWRKYVENGGHLVLTCRTALKDRDGHFPETQWAGMIVDLIGAKISMNDMLSSYAKAKVSFEGNTYFWNAWADILEPMAGTEVWATYGDQFYAGKASVVHRKLGKGTVTYVGTDSKDGKLEKDVLRRLQKEVGVSVAEQPEGVMVNWRDGFWVAINYASTNATIDIPASAKMVLGQRELTPAGVAVWQ